MSGLRIWQYRVSRAVGRIVTRVAAGLTLGRMPPFVSASAIVRQDGQILVVLDPIRKEPVLPGGHLRWWEHPKEALVREVREETGYDVEPGRVLGVFSGIELAGELGVVRVVYEGALRGGVLSSSAEGEACWMSDKDFESSSTRDAALVRMALDGQHVH